MKEMLKEWLESKGKASKSWQPRKGRLLQWTERSFMSEVAERLRMRPLERRLLDMARRNLLMTFMSSLVGVGVM